MLRVEEKYLPLILDFVNHPWRYYLMLNYRLQSGAEAFLLTWTKILIDLEDPSLSTIFGATFYLRQPKIQTRRFKSVAAHVSLKQRL